MLELGLAAAFFVALSSVTVLRARRRRPTVELSPMRATLERRVRDGVEFTL